MSRTAINSKNVFEASEALVAAGQTPAQGRICHYLGRGTRGTMHKYLKQWKENCFEKSFHLRSNPTIEDKALLEEKRILKKVAQNQISEQERLSTKMLETERHFQKIKKQNRVLIAGLEESKSQYTILESSYEELKDAMEK